MRRAAGGSTQAKHNIIAASRFGAFIRDAASSSIIRCVHRVPNCDVLDEFEPRRREFSVAWLLQRSLWAVPRGSYVSSSGNRSRVHVTMLRVILSASALMSSGCAYFHPAFITNASSLQTQARAKDGVLVCERHSLAGSDCAVMPHSEVMQVLDEIAGR